MENFNESRDNQYFNNIIPTALPNATAVLVLGIISIVGCFCYGVVGIICGIISLVLFSKDNKLYIANPQAYTLGSYSNLKAGRVCAIIGLIVSSIYFICLVAILAMFGLPFLTNPQHFINQFQ